MKKPGIILVALIPVILLLAACATPPTEEMNKAYDAVTRAENDADAVSYAGNTLTRARDALTRMQNEADAKRYDMAKTYATQAINSAERAIADGKAGAARAREEASTLVEDLGVPLVETGEALSSARNVENISIDYGALSENLNTARETYDEARQNLAEEKYPEAVAQGETVRSTLAEINTSINEAVEATSRKK